MLSGLALPSQAQDQSAAPLRQSSVANFIDLLDQPALSTRAFTLTAPPDPVTHRCPGGAVKPSAGKPAPGASSGRNLEIVAIPTESAGRADLQFNYASDALGASEKSMLEALATAMKSERLADKRFALSGHTDAQGSPATNLQLSCARSLAARNFLIKRGIADWRLAAFGFGSDRPLEGQSPEAAANRRVEVRTMP